MGNFRAIAFCRVSTTHQDYTRQISDLLPLIKKDGFDDSDVYIIKHKESASKNDVNNRKSITELKDVIANNPIESVYCTEASRLARRGDVLYSVLALLEENKISLVIQTPSIIRTYENGKPNPIAHVVIAFLGQVAQQEMELKKERQKSGYEQKKKDGKVCSAKVIFGYDRDKDGYAIINNDKANVVIDIFKSYLNNESVSSIWDRYTHTGVFNNLSLKSGWNLIGNILRDTTYIGHNKHFKYPPIMEDTLFYEVQHKLDANQNVKSKLKHIYYCQGLLKMEGYTMTPKINEMGYIYINPATQKHVGININAMDSLCWNLAAQAKASIESTTNEQRYAAMLEEIKNIDVKLNNINAEKAENDKRIERLNTIYIDGKINEETYKYRHQDLTEQLNFLLNEEETLNKQKLEYENVTKHKEGNEWMQQTIELSSILDIEDDKIRQDIIKETIHYVDIVETDKRQFDIFVHFYDAVLSTQQWHYRYIQKGRKKQLLEIYDDYDGGVYFEDITDSIVNRLTKPKK